MIQQLCSIEDFLKKTNSYIDCYISTTADEVEEILFEIGFKDITSDEKNRKTLYDDTYYFDLYYTSVKNKKTGLEIDCIDIPIEEAIAKRKEIDFMPMSKFRVYTNGSPNIVKILLPIMIALDKEKQNMAFFNKSGSSAYVKFSEFYR